MRYENPGMNITVPLEGTDYSALCIYTYNRKNDNYSLTIFLLTQGIDDPHYVDTQTITSSREKIREDICNIIEHASTIGFFDRYINRFTYYLECFDIGNEHFEKIALQS